MTPPGLTLPAGVVTRTYYLDYGGYPRAYTTFAPATGAGGLPMVVFISGTAATMATEVPRDGLLAQVAAGRLSLVYPAGLELRWNVDGVCCSAGNRPRADDEAFIGEVTQLATGDLNPDQGREYLFGYSGGARLAWQVACAGGTPFAALATYGAAPEQTCPSTGSALAVFIGFGTLDADQPIAGMATNKIGTHPPALVNVDTWRVRDGCPAPSTTATIGTAATAGGTVTEQEWTGCTPAGAPTGTTAVTAVTYALWKTGTHTIPDPPAYSAATSFATLALAFAEQFDLGRTGT